MIRGTDEVFDPFTSLCKACSVDNASKDCCLNRHFEGEAWVLDQCEHYLSVRVDIDFISQLRCKLDCAVVKVECQEGVLTLHFGSHQSTPGRNRCIQLERCVC